MRKYALLAAAAAALLALTACSAPAAEAPAAPAAPEATATATAAPAAEPPTGVTAAQWEKIQRATPAMSEADRLYAAADPASDWRDPAVRAERDDMCSAYRTDPDATSSAVAEYAVGKSLSTDETTVWAMVMWSLVINDC